MVKDYEPEYYGVPSINTGDPASLEPAPRPFPGEHLSDRELLLEIHEFMANINAMLVHVGPALDGISKSPIGKMLGIK